MPPRIIEPIVVEDSDTDSDTLSESERPSGSNTTNRSRIGDQSVRASHGIRNIQDDPASTSANSPQPPSQPCDAPHQPVTSNQQQQCPSSSIVAASSAAIDITSAAPASTSNLVASSSASTSQTSLTSLVPDRLQLERERKERARKRRRDQGLRSNSEDEAPDQGSDRRTRPRHEESSSSQSVSRGAYALDEPESPSVHWESATTPITPKARYWSGTVKHGFNRYAAPDRRGVTLAQMLLPATPTARNGLEEVVMATYDLRMDWLFSHFPPNLPVTLILPPPKEDYRSGDSSIARPGLHPADIFPLGSVSRYPNWKICVPNKPRGGWLTQHMKFLFLVHQSFLRVAILSGNLNEIDWDRIENTAFIQDFPLVNADAAASDVDRPKPLQQGVGVNDFKTQLLRILRSLSMPQSHPIFSALNKYDFSLASRARIVASWPESTVLTGWERIEAQGLGRLGKVVRDFGIRPPEGGVQLECQGSSLSNHDKKWLEHFHTLASGVNPRNILPFRGRPAAEHPEYFKALSARLGSLPPIKICFPCQRYVERTTIEGPDGALSFFGKAEQFEASPIKTLYHSPTSRRGHVMIHAKSILATRPDHKGQGVVDKAFRNAGPSGSSSSAAPPPKPKIRASWRPQPGEAPIGWTYLGSSNFTRAAHGNISGTLAVPTMSSSNWELGVVIPIYASEVELYGVEAECLRPIVYHRPVEAYTVRDTPWDNATAM